MDELIDGPEESELYTKSDESGQILRMKWELLV